MEQIMLYLVITIGLIVPHLKKDLSKRQPKKRQKTTRLRFKLDSGIKERLMSVAEEIEIRRSAPKTMEPPKFDRQQFNTVMGCYDSQEYAEYYINNLPEKEVN